MKFYKVFFSLMFNLIIVSNCISNDVIDSTKQNDFEKVLEKIYKTPYYIQNKITLESFYGYSKPSFPKEEFNDVLSRAYLLELRYGFTRIDDRLPVDNVLYYASEFAFVTNVTSHLKPKTWQNVGITSDSWRLGFGFKNGYGYIFDEKTTLILYHSAALNSNQTDFELNAKDSAGQGILNKFDKKLRFNNSFEGGIKLSVMDNINLNLSYEQNLTFSYFNFWEWFGSYFLEVFLQRSIDIFGNELLPSYPDYFPIANFILKNSISAVFYSLRSENSFFPSKSEYPLKFDSFKIGFTFWF